MVKIGQRYSYTTYSSTTPRFIVEVVKIRSERSSDVKVVQIIDWAEKVGRVYTEQNLLGDTEYWHYLEGQDKPEA
jgi:hypothetical protein